MTTLEKLISDTKANLDCAKKKWANCNKTIGETMRKEREQTGFSLRDIARRMGVSAPYLSDLENGRRIWSFDKIRAFKKALKGGQS